MSATTEAVQDDNATSEAIDEAINETAGDNVTDKTDEDDGPACRDLAN